ncbi:hypothetical protein GCM10012276_15740 [Nocardioides deserti]|nr:hypothetical protein GCM10012276_15740 [Nocardioides deserti]
MGVQSEAAAGLLLGRHPEVSDDVHVSCFLVCTNPDSGSGTSKVQKRGEEVQGSDESSQKWTLGHDEGLSARRREACVVARRVTDRSLTEG